MLLVGVAPNKHAFGVDGAEDDWTVPAGEPGNCRELVSKGRVVGRGVRTPYVATHLDRVLHDAHDTDAHLLPFVMRAPDGSICPVAPRVNKAGLPFVLAQGFSLELWCLFADIDNPGHIPWDDESFAIAREQDASSLVTAGVYYTNNGRRIVQPLTRPIVVDHAATCELQTAGWLRDLMSRGYVVDASCQDWTRHYRLPNVRRDGHLSRSRCVDTSRMREVLPPSPGAALGKKRPQRGAPIPSGATSDPRETPLGKAFAAMGWLGRSLGPGKVTAVCPWQASHSMGRAHDTSTVLFGGSETSPLGRLHCSHGHCVGRTVGDTIAALDPEVRRQFIPALSTPSLETGRPEPVSLAEAQEAIQEAIRRAPDGLTTIISGCGAGKTHAAVKVAVERSRSLTRRRRKTVFSVPTHKLADEIAERLRAEGTGVVRRFGAASGVEPCHHQALASAVANGGLSVQRHLCEGGGRRRCSHFDDCRARVGSSGDEGASVIIGVHENLSELAAEAGRSGLLVVDEPPGPFSHVAITGAQLIAALRSVDVLESRFAASFRAVLGGIISWLETAELDEHALLHDVIATFTGEDVNEATSATSTTTLLEAVRAAVVHLGPVGDANDGDAVPGGLPPFPRRQSIPLASKDAVSVIATRTEIERIAEVTRVVAPLYAALLADRIVTSARVEERQGHRVLALITVDDRVHSAITREGATVVLDANGRLNLRVYEKLTGYTANMVEVYVPDGAEVSREVRRMKAARAHLFAAQGRELNEENAARALGHVTQWLRLHEPKRWAMVTFMGLERALEVAMGRREREPDEPTYAGLKSIVDTWPVLPDLGHYGAIRGLDHWKGHDGLVTVGDPFPVTTDVEREASWLELGSSDERLTAYARAELEQAHGRLRTPHRSEPTSGLHVGGILPGGWEGVSTEGPSKATLEAAKAKHGARATAKLLGVSYDTLKRWTRAA